jgi:ribosome-binding protein aMBF1 (putative translation factor)
MSDMSRGMPHQARALSELLSQKQELENQQQQWSSSASQLFVATRLASGMSGNSFAASIGISQPYLFQIEHGQRTPSPETLDKLRSFVEGDSVGHQDEAEDQDA